MPWTYTDDYYKQYTRDTWNESAPGYTPILRNLDRFNDDLLAAVPLNAGDRVLDVATGPGEPALTIAPRVLPGGRVMGVDLSETMVEMARERAKRANVDNLVFEVMDAEALTVADDAFDVVTCRFGLQIVTDPEAAALEILRVLRPGGHLAATVWGPGERCPAIDVIIAPMLEYAEPDESGYLPTPYEMGGEGELVNLLEDLGFEGGSEHRVTRDWTFPNVQAYLDASLKGTPIGHSLAEEDEDVQREVLRKTHENLRKYTLPDGSLALPAECVVVTAIKP